MSIVVVAAAPVGIVGVHDEDDDDDDEMLCGSGGCYNLSVMIGIMIGND